MCNGYDSCVYSSITRMAYDAGREMGIEHMNGTSTSVEDTNVTLYIHNTSAVL